MKKRILLLQGPNLNMLGKREQSIYGSFTYEDTVFCAQTEAAARGYELESYQSNHEGALLDFIHENLNRYAGVIINAGAYTHTSVALFDALLMLPCPVVELHISDIYAREPFRQTSRIRPACAAQICGLGLKGYVKAVEYLDDLIYGRKAACTHGKTEI